MVGHPHPRTLAALPARPHPHFDRAAVQGHRRDGLPFGSAARTGRPGKALYKVTEAVLLLLLSLSRSVIYEEIRSGRLRSFKRGRSRLIPARAITDYVTLLEGKPGRLMTARRGHGGGDLYYDTSRKRWIAASRWLHARRQADHPQESAATKTAAQRKLKELNRNQDDGYSAPAEQTVASAVIDWLEHGLNGRGEQTKATSATLARTHSSRTSAPANCASCVQQTLTNGWQRSQPPFRHARRCWFAIEPVTARQRPPHRAETAVRPGLPACS